MVNRATILNKNVVICFQITKLFCNKILISLTSDYSKSVLKQAINFSDI